jgi:hypothetical protein
MQMLKCFNLPKSLLHYNGDAPNKSSRNARENNSNFNISVIINLTEFILAPNILSAE